MRFFILLSFIFIASFTYGQKKIAKTLKNLNQNSVPYITIDSLHLTKDYYILDTREKEEYDVSHLKNAIWVGYDSFNIKSISSKITNKNTPIIVYCSIGVRSEDIGEKLITANYKNVKNLYGGIFLWKENGNTVYDSLQKETNKVHVFSKQWSKLLTNAEKIY